MKEFITYLLFTLLSFQYLQAKENPYFFDNYNDQNGLIHNHVLSIYKDSRNLLWIGGYGGLQYFDGHEFHNFNIVGKENINKLSHTTIQYIFEDQENNLWFGTESGLNKYDVNSGEVTIYQNQKYFDLKSDNIRAIVQDKEGIFWIGTYGGGLIRFNEKSKKFTSFNASILYPDKVGGMFINTLNLQGDKLWIGTEKEGVTVFDIKHQKIDKKLQKKLLKTVGLTINTLFFDLKKELWIGTWGNGIFHYDNNFNFKKQYVYEFDNPSSLNGDIVKVIAQKNRNELWIGTYGNGIATFNIKKQRFDKVEEKKRSSSLDYIWTALFDQNDCWYGTFGYGLMKLNLLKSTFTYDTIDEEKVIRIDQIIKGYDDNVLIRSEKDGLFDMDDQFNIKSYDFIDKKNVTAIYIDHNKNLWVAYGEKLECYNQDNKLIHSFNPSSDNNLMKGKIKCILQDENGNYWFAYDKENILFLNQKSLNDVNVSFQKINEVFKQNPLPIYGQVSYFSIDRDNNVWIGTPIQLLEVNIDKKEYKSYNIPVVTSLIRDEQGNTWAGTNGDALYQIDNIHNKVKRFGYEEGLECIDIQSLELDGRKRIWMGTSCGLSVLDLKSLKVMNFGSNYGLKKFSFNLNVSLKQDDGNFVFGGNHGLVNFNPNIIGQDHLFSPLYITDIKQDNVSIAYENGKDSLVTIHGLLSEVDTIVIPSSHHILTFKFASINFENATNAYYAYQLEGYDAKWIETSMDERTATFTKLPAGKYQLNIKSSYNKGYWNSDIKSYVIIVKGKFYEMIWFKISVFTLLILILVLVIKSYYKRLQLEGLFDEKNKEIFKLMEEKKEVDFQNNHLQKEVSLNQQQLHELRIKYDLIKEHMNSMYQNVSEYIDSSSQPSSNSLNSVKDNLKSIQDDPIFEQIKDIDSDKFITDFAKEYPKLTATDLRICKLVRQNKTNKEIAQILNITQSSLDQSRYRIRKKMELEKSINLNDLILRF